MSESQGPPPRPKRRAGVLAIDRGTEKHGFALTDALRIAREPLPPLRAKWPSPEFERFLKRCLAERDIDTLLVGLPLNMDGSESRASERSRRCAAVLQQAHPHLRVLLYDERLTTKAAQERLVELGLSEPDRRDPAGGLAALRRARRAPAGPAAAGLPTALGQSPPRPARGPAAAQDRVCRGERR